MEGKAMNEEGGEQGPMKTRKRGSQLTEWQANSQDDICNKFIPKPSAMQLLISLYLSLLWHPLSRSSHHQWCWLWLQRRKAGYQKQASGPVLSDDSQSLSLSRTRRDGGIPIARCTNKQIFFFPVVLLLGFFFFCFSLAVCVSVSIPMTGFSFAYLPARGPANAGNRCILSIRAAVQFAAFRIRTTCTWSREWRRGGKESIASLAGGKLEIQLTMHLSLCVLCRSHVSKTAEMGWRRDVLIFLNHHGTSFERNEFFFCFFSSFCKVLVYCSLWFSAFFHHHLWPVRT
jgi:hypothetical protein